MGLSLLSWANSIGDFVADYSLAKAGRARTAVWSRSGKSVFEKIVKIAACFGAPLLNLLVGVGFGCTITILTTESKDDIPLDVCSFFSLFFYMFFSSVQLKSA